MNNREPSLLVKSAFIYAGLTKFTRQAYLYAAKSFDTKFIPNLDGRVYMVTGANSGIGRATTKALLEGGGTVHMACRSKKRAIKARDILLEETGVPESRCHVHIVDLSSIKQVKAFARSFNKGIFGARLDGLVNNAGCMLHKFEKNNEGNELNFATNTMGTFVLTQELLPSLQSPVGTDNDPSRVVVVSSGGAYSQKLDPINVQTEEGFNDGTYVYAQNKRQQIALVEIWARESISGLLGFNKEEGKSKPESKPEAKPEAKAEPEKRNVWFQSMHPGWADTPAVRKAMPDFHRQMQGRWRSEEEGADTIVWLTTSTQALKHQQGQFFLDRTPQRKFLWGTWTTHTQDDADRLYKVCTNISNGVEPVQDNLTAFDYMQSNASYEKYMASLET
ncbi:hypothetical protein AAMO2058_000066700 [Amorphochlora amoebiformis]